MKSLKITNLKKRFKNINAVNGISLEINEGEIIGIIGRSGAGKSTLLRMINRLVEPSEGSIEFDDINITSLKGKALRKWRSECAMIFQQFKYYKRNFSSFKKRCKNWYISSKMVTRKNMLVTLR